MNQIIFNDKLIKKYQKNLPRYTSYPTADKFNNEFTTEAQQIELINTSKYKSISLYIHIPFCNTLCLFCTCNKIITNKRDKIDEYLLYLRKELSIYKKIWNSITQEKIRVNNIHFGGGSPSWMTVEQLNQVMAIIYEFFEVPSDTNIAMEIDPRRITYDFIEALAHHKFNRLSFGVQDTNHKVQKLINRIQPIEQTIQVISWAQSLGINSINIDLIYGLPLQTVESYKDTIDHVINNIRPSRIALYNYAHLPHIFAAQKKLNDHRPSGDEKLNILKSCVEALSKAGYYYIGMDHFALPEDELSIALSKNCLKRNFQGYSVEQEETILGIGVSAISTTPTTYWQNLKTIEEYYSALEKEDTPLRIGVTLTKEDVLCRDIIHTLMGQLFLNFEEFNQKYNIDFLDKFSKQLDQLKPLIEDNLLEITETEIRVLPIGRFLIRNIVCVFDQYLNSENRYSKSI